MKLNFKRGLRRLFYTIVALCTAFALCYYIIGGCIFDTSKFISSTSIYKQDSPEKQLDLVSFANTYLKPDDDLFGYIPNSFDCHPYKQYCQFKNITFYANRNNLVKIENFEYYTDAELIKMYKHGEKAQRKLYVAMPSPAEYFKWQVQDLFLIILSAGISLLLYFLIEFILCWIIKGFKE